MTLVADASLAVCALTEDPRAIQAEQAFALAAPAHAPDLIVAEIANAARQLQRARRIPEPQMQEIVAGIPRLIDVFHPLSPLAERAAEIARALDHPVYDCFYLALAERLGCAVATLDTRLVARLDGTPFAGRAALPEALAED